MFLKTLIAAVTGQEPSSECGCNSKAAKLNAWGWRGCLENADTICQWLAEEAVKYLASNPHSATSRKWRPGTVTPEVKTLMQLARDIMAERGVTLDLEQLKEPLEAWGKACDDDEGLAALLQKKIEEWGLV